MAVAIRKPDYVTLVLEGLSIDVLQADIFKASDVVRKYVRANIKNKVENPRVLILPLLKSQGFRDICNGLKDGAIGLNLENVFDVYELSQVLNLFKGKQVRACVNYLNQVLGGCDNGFDSERELRFYMTAMSKFSLVKANISNFDNMLYHRIIEKFEGFAEKQKNDSMMNFTLQQLERILSSTGLCIKKPLNVLDFLVSWTVYHQLNKGDFTYLAKDLFSYIDTDLFTRETCLRVLRRLRTGLKFWRLWNGTKHEIVECHSCHYVLPPRLPDNVLQYGVNRRAAIANDAGTVRWYHGQLRRHKQLGSIRRQEPETRENVGQPPLLRRGNQPRQFVLLRGPGVRR